MIKEDWDNIKFLFQKSIEESEDGETWTIPWDWKNFSLGPEIMEWLSANDISIDFNIENKFLNLIFQESKSDNS